jgi:hypothetical protein
MATSDEALTRADLERIGDAAVESVRADLERTAGSRVSNFRIMREPRAERDRWIEYGLPRSCSTADRWTSMTVGELTADFGNCFQEDCSQSSLGCWPECTTHAVGLHADVVDGIPVWNCRFGEHVVSPIGELGMSMRERRRRAT